MKDKKSWSRFFKLDRAFFYSFIFLLLLILGVAVSALIIALEAKKKSDNVIVNQVDVNTKIRRYAFLKATEAYAYGDFKKDFFEFPAISNSQTQKKDLIAKNKFYQELSSKIGIDQNNEENLEKVRLMHNFFLLFTTNGNNINGHNKNAIRVDVFNYQLQVSLINHNSFNNPVPVQPFQLSGSKQKKELDSKTLQFNDHFDLEQSDFHVFLLKEGGRANINNFDLALLVNRFNLAVTLVIRRPNTITKTPRLILQKKAGALWKNSATSLSWKAPLL